MFRFVLNRSGVDNECDRQTDRQTDILIENAALHHVARPKMCGKINQQNMKLQFRSRCCLWSEIIALKYFQRRCGQKQILFDFRFWL